MDSKILAVGAGGIGCELLKTLVATGFKNIEIIDLDTIEVSNLNRQFLFRKHHVGQSKASVAAESVKRFKPDVHITAHHANIKDPQYNIDFFRKFDLVLNGLDNLDARRHVNLMCLAADVPLVESGTAGYLGQVTVHISRNTECFDCQPKPVPKSHPVCTIRTSPEKPIHTIVWAKELLFPFFFGSKDGESDLDSDGTLARQDSESISQYIVRIFNAMFDDKIQDVIKAAEAGKDAWIGKKKPRSLCLGDLQKENDYPQKKVNHEDHAQTACAALGLTDHHTAWNASQNAAVFMVAAELLLKRMARGDSIEFDKDDELAVEFVTAASNLRSLCFNIPPQSLFDAKGMAGNIIHAIATTNAIISGFIVVEAMKILSIGLSSSLLTGNTNDAMSDTIHGEKNVSALCRTTFLRQDLSNRKIITPVNLEPPNPSCYVCSGSRLELYIDTKNTTLGQFIDLVAREHLGMPEPSISMFDNASGGSFLYDELCEEIRDPEDEEAMALYRPMMLDSLPAGGIIHNTMIKMSDSSRGLEVNILVYHQETWDEKEHPKKYSIKGKISIEKKIATIVMGEMQEEDAGETRPRLAAKDNEGAFVILDDDDDEEDCVEVGVTKKRKHEEEEAADSHGGKKPNVIELID